MIKIVTDSSCDIKNLEVPYERVPLTITKGDVHYIDNNELNIEEMVCSLENSKEKTSTACPSPQLWYDAAKNYEEVFFIPLTKELSGSYSSAMIAKEMLEEEGKKVYVVDTMSASAGIVLYVEKIVSLIKENKTFDNIKSIIKGYKVKLNFILFSIDNLVKNGRASKVSGMILNTLGISLIGGEKDGILNPLHKTKGLNKSINLIIQEMKNNCYNKGKIVISHCFNIEGAQKLKDKIVNEFGNVSVDIFSTSGLCSYYAERKGLLISYEI